MQVPIETIHLFPKLEQKLLELLKSLHTDDWAKPTLAKQWTVKDVATHLLDGNIRTISMMRDNFFGENPGTIDSYQDLVGFLNRLNADWVKATKRMSPAVLIELLEITGKEFHAAMEKLEPFKPAIFSVAWAGEEQSLNWFHVAREYTEKWHHQQQIREAVGKQGIMSREFYYPLIDTFLQALPHTYRNTHAKTGDALHIIISSDSGGDWFLMYDPSGWELVKQKPSNIVTTIAIDADVAWKLFTKALSRTEAQAKIKFSGDEALGKPILSMLSVMA